VCVCVCVHCWIIVGLTNKKKSKYPGKIKNVSLLKYKKISKYNEGDWSIEILLS